MPALNLSSAPYNEIQDFCQEEYLYYESIPQTISSNKHILCFQLNTTIKSIHITIIQLIYNVVGKDPIGQFGTSSSAFHIGGSKNVTDKYSNGITYKMKIEDPLTSGKFARQEEYPVTTFQHLFTEIRL